MSRVILFTDQKDLEKNWDLNGDLVYLLKEGAILLEDIDKNFLTANKFRIKYLSEDKKTSNKYENACVNIEKYNILRVVNPAVTVGITLIEAHPEEVVELIFEGGIFKLVSLDSGQTLAVRFNLLQRPGKGDRYEDGELDKGYLIAH